MRTESVCYIQPNKLAHEDGVNLNHASADVADAKAAGIDRPESDR